MRKLLKVFLVVILLVVVCGCGVDTTKSGGKGTITCVSEAVGSNPEIVFHEEYVVKDNKVRELNIYKEVTYTEEFLKNMAIDNLMEIYEDEDSSVEKISATKIKVVSLKPYNAFEFSKTDDIISLIVDSLEENEFALYKYKCEVK